MAKKSLISNFNALAVSKMEKPIDQNVSKASVSSVRVGAGVIGAAQRTLTDIREERDRLAALVENGQGGIVELDTGLIDVSPFSDRLPDDDEKSFSTFKHTIEIEGQKIPVQVRNHPHLKDRYQIIYGHRRVRAAKELNRPVKALIVAMDDRDLAIVQGLENVSRQDLSWIEKTVFAQNMERANVKPRDIKLALGIDDAELARMRSVWRTIPDNILYLIGRSPKVGRPRWIELVRLLTKQPDLLVRMEPFLEKEDIKKLNSNSRFIELLKELKNSSSEKQLNGIVLKDLKGENYGTVRMLSGEVRIFICKDKMMNFSKFFEENFSLFFQQFLEQEK